ncbi:MAG: hypothetical protein AAFY02_18725 [Pseudomonadota bacterium]
MIDLHLACALASEAGFRIAVGTEGVFTDVAKGFGGIERVVVVESQLLFPELKPTKDRPALAGIILRRAAVEQEAIPLKVARRTFGKGHIAAAEEEGVGGCAQTADQPVVAAHARKEVWPLSAEMRLFISLPRTEVCDR